MVRHLARADIIHYHQTHTFSAGVALLFAKAARKPIVTTDLGSGGWGIHNHLDVTRWYSGHLHISEFSRRVFGQESLDTARVILGGVDTEKFSPRQNAARMLKMSVVYVGRLLPHKGINYLIEAVDESTPVELIGRRWRHAQGYYELLKRLAAGKMIGFAEDCDDAEIIRAYRQALCVVLPSVYRTVAGDHYTIPELLGQTLLEGMACGAPAICTAVGAMPEVVEDGVTGFVVPPNDPAALGAKIRWLQEHPAEARQMGEAARKRVIDHFSWDRVVDRCFEAYGISRPEQGGSASQTAN
jgi:glycosyltransferase involved in cell wall biosynthesis